MNGAERHSLAVRELAAAFGACLIEEFQSVLHRHFGIAGFGRPGVEQAPEELGPYVGLRWGEDLSCHLRKVAGLFEGAAFSAQLVQETVYLANLMKWRYGVASRHPAYRNGLSFGQGADLGEVAVLARKHCDGGPIGNA